MKNKICVKKLNAVTFDVNKNRSSRAEGMAIASEMIKLGYVPSDRLLDMLQRIPARDLIRVHSDIISTLSAERGFHDNYNPMYPNFPQQVKDASSMELFFNAIRHYLTRGAWVPTYAKEPRPRLEEVTETVEIDYADHDDYMSVFDLLLASNDSLSEFDKSAVFWFLDTEPNIMVPENIPYKETACILAARSLEMKKNDVSLYVKTTTDVLRLAVHLSGGDVSLAENTKFKIAKRFRKPLISILEEVISEEDVKRHENRWKRLFHTLHVGEYKWAAKVNAIAKKVRNGENLVSVLTDYDFFMKHGDVNKAFDSLKGRPGELARRLDHIIRSVPEAKNQKSFVEEFVNDIADKVSTRVLMQILGNVKARRNNRHKETIVFPKGAIGKAVKVNREGEGTISAGAMSALEKGIGKVLFDRFAEEEGLGNVFIDEGLKKIPLPQQQRSASESMKTISRGSRVPFDGNNTIRLFCYWVGQDIDLSASFHDDNFNMVSQVSYTNLRNGAAYHSGDIVSAPDGASEFIDIDVKKAEAEGHRYIVLNLYVYSGPNFSDHKVCFAGWMDRKKPNSGEVYEPTTVVNRVDISSASRNCIPVMFDIKTREVIWVDLPFSANKLRNSFYGGNNVQNNRAKVQEVVGMFANLNEQKTSLYDLLEIHAKSRGKIVKDREDADFVFGVSDGDLTAYDVNTINADFIKG